MENLSQKVLEQIKDEKIAPTPRWHFVFRNYFVWLAAASSFLVGGFSLAIVYENFFDNDLDVHIATYGSFWKAVIFAIPYIWLLLLAAFIFYSFHALRKTKEGYKCNSYWLVPLGILASVLLSFVFYLSDVSGSAERFFASCGFCRHFIFDDRVDIWSHPEKGFLAGIIATSSGDILIIRDFSGALWTVGDKGIIFRQPMMLNAGTEIRFLGRETGSSTFSAREARPWGCGAMGVDKFQKCVVNER